MVVFQRSSKTGPGASHLEIGAVPTLELRRQGLLVLLVLQRHRLGPPQLIVHLVGHHPPVEDAADHGEQQKTLEDPPLPAGAHPGPHAGAAPLPAACATKPRRCCWELLRELFSVPEKRKEALSVTAGALSCLLLLT